jgi:hypothetical protein
LSLWGHGASGAWPDARPRFVSSIPRRGRVFRTVAHALVWAFLAQVLPATAFADLSVPIRIPAAEWRKAMRKEIAVEFLCVMAPKPGDEVRRERPVPEDEGERGRGRGQKPRPMSPQLMRVSTAPLQGAPRTVEEAIAQGYTCRVLRRGRQFNAAWDGAAGAQPWMGLWLGQEPNQPQTEVASLVHGRALIPLDEWRDAMKEGSTQTDGCLSVPEVPTPNPSRMADGVWGRGSCHVDGGSRSFVPRPDGRFTAEVERLPFSPSARAGIRSLGGNLGAATRTFRTDATSPNLLIAAPPSGAMLSEARPQIRLTFADAGTEPSGVIPTSLTASLDGVDITPALTRTATDAVGLPPTALTSGPHQLSATIVDVAGNTTTVTSGFHVDTVPPVVTTVSPTANQVLGSATVAVAASYSDNHELNLDSFRATIDGVAVPIVVDADSASGSMSGLVDGPHLLTLSIADRAGNVRTTTTAFSTDTGGPQIAVVTPPNGVLLNLRNPELLVTFEDGQGLDLSSLRIRVNGADRTADFTRTTTEARATLADALPEGVNTIAVEIRDQASNIGAASSSFTLDVTAPTVTVRAPIANAFLNDATPDVQIDLADSLTGVEPTATRIFVDDIDVTADFSIGPTLAAGTLSNALSEGPHTLRVVTADRAANPTVVEVVFVIDLTAPTMEMASPREGSFTNDPTPEIWLRTADPIPASGIGPAAGVSSASIRVFLLSTDPAVPDTDLTPLLTIDASESRGEFTTALPDGTHRLRAVARDHAGNEAEITVGFVVDTTAPTVAIDQPQNATFLPTAEPTIVLLYSDERSGIDPDLTQVKVDGIERAASLTLTPTGATLTLSSVLGLSLADGPHQIEARVVDQAGNAMEAAPVTFGVDTVAPTAAITSPLHQSFVGVAQPSVAFTLQDAAPSSGINTEFIRVFLDGVDITANATLTPGGEGALTATAAVAMPLSDGLHTLRVTAIDNANQQAEAISQFTVDTTPPVVTPAGPGNGSTIGASLTNGNGTFTLTFSFVDIDPSTTATCTSGPTSVSASPQGEGHSCILPIVEGLNTFAVTVTDSTGHSSTLTKTLILDTLVPGVAISTPLAASVTSAQTTTVQGTVADATAVTVSVNGVPANVVPGLNGSPTTFEAQGVAVGPGPSATFEAVAQDLGGNTGRASVSIIVDRILPLVTIATPASGAYLPGAPATVNVDVVDATATTLEINGLMATRGACQPAATAQEPSRQRCSYEASVPVTPGAFQITAIARDAPSNQGLAQVSVIVDGIAPVLTVTAPAAGLVTSATSVTVTGTVADTSPATLTIDGAPTALATDGAFSADIPAGPEGLRTIQLLARDAAGNETARSSSVIVDRTAPVLTIGQPTNAARLGSSSTPVIVQFADDQLDPSTFVATLDGAPFTMTLAEGSATGLAENLAEGPHTVSVPHRRQGGQRHHARDHVHRGHDCSKHHDRTARAVFPDAHRHALRLGRFQRRSRSRHRNPANQGGWHRRDQPIHHHAGQRDGDAPAACRRRPHDCRRDHGPHS